jgi:hypothetical protein
MERDGKLELFEKIKISIMGGNQKSMNLEKLS